MQVSVYRSGDLMGKADVAEVSGQERLRSRALSGPFHPTPAFAAIWPLFAEQTRVGSVVLSAMLELPRAIGPQDLPEAIRAVLPDGTLAALAQADSAIDALHLTARDETGEEITGVSISVGEWSMFDHVEQSEEARRALEEGMAREGIPASGFV